MEIIHYETDDYDSFINNIIMIPEKNNNLNGFYKIIKSTPNFFCVKKMKCQTNLIKTYNNDDSNTESKIYEATIMLDFENETENDTYKKIKKTSINKKYPVIYTSVVQYEV